MITKEEAILLLDRMKKTRPDHFFEKVNDSDEGMRFVLIYLSKHNDDVYATNIANEMHISRARMAILLKKLEAKDLISKYPSKTDKRIEVIRITDKGLEEVNRIKDNVISTIIKIVDVVGIDDINNFIDISSKIKDVLNSIE
ncbi:MAG: winged helix-turn-helix transcriptional regulator [Acholeplasmatales bacterium]|nr:winged helix-turn-helix transcriptional regulator [Acholeplasmatales bacterium]